MDVKKKNEDSDSIEDDDGSELLQTPHHKREIVILANKLEGDYMILR